MRPRKSVLTRPSPATTMALPFKSPKPEVLGCPLADIIKKLTIASLGSLVGNTITLVPKVE